MVQLALPSSICLNMRRYAPFRELPAGSSRNRRGRFQSSCSRSKAEHSTRTFASLGKRTRVNPSGAFRTESNRVTGGNALMLPARSAPIFARLARLRFPVSDSAVCPIAPCDPLVSAGADWLICDPHCMSGAWRAIAFFSRAATSGSASHQLMAGLVAIQLPLGCVGNRPRAFDADGTSTGSYSNIQTATGVASLCLLATAVRFWKRVAEHLTP